MLGSMGPRTRSVIAVLTASMALAALTACGGKPEDPGTATSTVTASSDTTKTGAPAPAPLGPVWPLTGVEAADIAARPGVTIKIENSTSSRPQAGLNQADIVWEETVEGGITRFAAMFNSQVPDRVGPIRSIRPMDANIAAPTHGLIVFSGGLFEQEALDVGLQTVSMDHGDPGFHRDSSRKAPHNVYADAQDFFDQADADHSAPPASILSYARDAASSSVAATGTPTSVVDCTFSSVAAPNWTWDAASGTWLRSEYQKESVDEDGDRLSAVNVVVMRVTTRPTGYVDPAGTPVPETVLIGEGDATVAVGGKTVEVRWSKASADAPVVLTDANGAAVTLAPGRTWIELVTLDTGSVTVTQ